MIGAARQLIGATASSGPLASASGHSLSRSWTFVERLPLAAMVYIGAELFDELGEPIEPDLGSWIVGMDDPAGTGDMPCVWRRADFGEKRSALSSRGRLVAIVGAA